MEYQEPIAIANYFISLSLEENKPLTNYKLQKMLFFVNQLSKKNTGQLLFNEKFQPTAYGSFLPSVHEEFGGFGSDILTGTHGQFEYQNDNPFKAQYVPFNKNSVNKNVQVLCRKVFNKYIDCTLPELLTKYNILK